MMRSDGALTARFRPGGGSLSTVTKHAASHVMPNPSHFEIHVQAYMPWHSMCWVHRLYHKPPG